MSKHKSSTDFNFQPTLNGSNDPELSLCEILCFYYGQFFDDERAKKLAAEYIAAYKKQAVASVEALGNQVRG